MKIYSRLTLIIVLIIAIFFSYGYIQSIKLGQTNNSDLMVSLNSFIVSGVCSFKNVTGYTLCCMVGDTANDCTNRTSFTCGEEVGFLETIRLDEQHGVYCFKQDLHPNGTIAFDCYNFTGSSQNGAFTDYVTFIPPSRSNITFSEVYAFSKNVSYNTNAEYLQNIKLADKLLTAEVNVTCD